jgi:hypothetical protein
MAGLCTEWGQIKVENLRGLGDLYRVRSPKPLQRDESFLTGHLEAPKFRRPRPEEGLLNLDRCYRSRSSMVERVDFVDRIGAYLVRSSNSIVGNPTFTPLSDKLPV